MQKLGNKKLSKAVSTKLTDEDYELCRRLARDYYINGKIKIPVCFRTYKVALVENIELNIALIRIYHGKVAIRNQHLDLESLLKKMMC